MRQTQIRWRLRSSSIKLNSTVESENSPAFLTFFTINHLRGYSNFQNTSLVKSFWLLQKLKYLANAILFTPRGFHVWDISGVVYLYISQPNKFVGYNSTPCEIKKSRACLSALLLSRLLYYINFLAKTLLRQCLRDSLLVKLL